MDIIRSDERGFQDHGWLKSYHTFSFADYYNPRRIHFGMLRVVNDDVIEGNQGFGKHGHRDMEIISIPLTGSLAHKDSTGGKGIILPGEVQVMSAGTGVMHSEVNPSENPGNFLQIWIFPDKRGVTPRYEQKKFDDREQENQLQLLVSPDGRQGSLWIYQNAFISRYRAGRNNPFSYNPFNAKNGVFIFILEGKAVFGAAELNRRDAILTLPEDTITISPESNTQLLFIEVPMQ
jgi:quercetin 2,3-dioxygenase